MKRRRILLLLALAAVAGGVVLFWPRGPNDPVYEGKRLSQWLGKTNQWTKRAGVTPEARKAVERLGTNAIPYLLHEFEYRESKWLAALKQTRFVGRMLNLRFQPTRLRRDKATSALSCLGPELASALPRLALYLDDPERGPQAVWLMQCSGEAGAPFLYRGLFSNDTNVLKLSVSYLSNFHTAAAESAVPRFIQLAEHPDRGVRHTSIMALRKFPSATASSLPVLRRALADSTLDVRRAAVSALGMLGANASSAVPDLLTMLKDSDAYCALLASNAVFHIDPAALPARRP